MDGDEENNNAILNPEAPVAWQCRSGPNGTLIPLGPGEGIRPHDEEF